MSLASDFEAILRNPIVYTLSAPKEAYKNATVICDRCGMRDIDTYISSNATPKIDLCAQCFNSFQSSSVGTPHNVISHASSSMPETVISFPSSRNFAPWLQESQMK